MLDGLLVGPGPQIAADVTERLRETRPDVVVSTFLALGAMTAAEGAHLPYVVLVPNVYALPAPGMPPFGLGTPPANSRLTRLRDRAVGAIVARQWNRGLKRLNELRETYGLAPIEDLWDQVRQATKVLVLTSGRFDFAAELPGSVRYVGPVLDDPPWAAAQEWCPPLGDDPLVLVAMSSTFQNHIDSLQRCIDALSTLPVRGVVTTGPAIDPAALHPASNIQIVKAAPHSEVFKHASAVITHGGHGTVVRALAAGLSLVVMPHGRDQGDNAVRVTARNAVSR
jgi:MGT family glycosyltransferase